MRLRSWLLVLVVGAGLVLVLLMFLSHSWVKAVAEREQELIGE